MKKVVSLIVLLSLLLPQTLFANTSTEASNFYEVEVALWHAHEDKVSMGSDGIKTRAELIKEEGEMKLYLSLQTITAFDLTTSLERLFIYNEASKAYEKAEGRAFSLALEKKAKKNPKVIIVPLLEEKTFYPVLVDPGIALMGRDPIKARLKVSWESLKPIAKEEASIYNEASSNETCEHLSRLEAGEVRLYYDEKEAEFQLNAISKKDIEAKGLKLSPLDRAKGYTLTLISPLKVIPEDKTTNTSLLAEPIAFSKKERLVFLEEGYDEVLLENEGVFEKLEAKKTVEGLEVMVARLGDFVLLKKGEAENLSATTQKKAPLPVKTASAKKPIRQSLKKVNKVDRKTVQDKALLLKEATNEEKIENALEKAPKPRECYGLIALIFSLYAMLGLLGVYLCKRAYGQLKDELERRHYIQGEKQKGGTK